MKNKIKTLLIFLFLGLNVTGLFSGRALGSFYDPFSKWNNIPDEEGSMSDEGLHAVLSDEGEEGGSSFPCDFFISPVKLVRKESNVQGAITL